MLSRFLQLQFNQSILKGNSMKYIFVIIIVVIVLYFVFKHLLEQSKKPTGIIGNFMMKLWNNVYLPMAEWCLSFLEKKRI